MKLLIHWKYAFDLCPKAKNSSRETGYTAGGSCWNTTVWRSCAGELGIWGVWLRTVYHWRAASLLPFPVVRQHKLWLSGKKKKKQTKNQPHSSTCLSLSWAYRVMEEEVGGMVWLAWPPGSESLHSKGLWTFPSCHNPCEWGRSRLLPPARGTEVWEFHSEWRGASGSMRSILTRGNEKMRFLLIARNACSSPCKRVQRDFSG